MKISYVVVATTLVALAGCFKVEEPKKATPQEAPKQAEPRQATKPPPSAAAQPPSAAAQPPAGAGITGEVVETMDSGGYTYVQVDAGPKGKVWAAGPNTEVKVGDTAGFTGGMVMQNFESKTLNRTFASIYFVDAIRVGEGGGGGANPAAGAASQPAGHGAPQPSPKVQAGQIETAEGGLTVAEVFAESEALKGKKVRVRGKVVKYNPNIMGKNWLHVQDGTGEAGTHDLTVTTDASAKVGDVVLVEGVLATDKDFGSGYSYPVLVEDASITE